jgi:hypothetical protein
MSQGLTEGYLTATPNVLWSVSPKMMDVAISFVLSVVFTIERQRGRTPTMDGTDGWLSPRDGPHMQAATQGGSFLHFSLDLQLLV